MHKALLGQTLGAAEFNDLDDISIMHCFKIWSGGDDATLAELCGGLLFRKLFKVIDISGMEESQARDAFAKACDVVQKAGGDADYDLFLDEPARDMDESFDSADAILVKGRDGKVSSFAEHSPLVGALNRQLAFRRIHLAEQWRDQVKAALR